jgi:peptide/nickel transport system ATP-binding protein
MSRLSSDIRIAAEGKFIVDIRDFSLERDRVTFLLGESGIGKSLVSRALYGLLDPVELAVTVDGRAYPEYLAGEKVRAIKEHGFFVFQEPSSHLNPLMTLGDQLREGALARAAGRPEVLQALWEGSSLRDLDSILEVYPKPYRPSGGEKQRILLAMALEKIDMLPPALDSSPEALFIFDEPSGSLDNHFRDLFLDLLFDRFRRRPFTALVITHDYSMISRVTQACKDVIDRVDFRELARRQGKLVMNDFEPGTYTGWVAGLRRFAETAVSPRKPVLIVEPVLEVFGRGLVVTQDAEGREPARLTVSPGTMVYLKAPSGTGKTTLVKRVMGLIQGGTFEATLKEIRLTGATPRRLWHERIWGKSMTMVFQHADEALNMHSTMRETLTGLPLREPLTTDRMARLAAELFDAGEVGELLGKKVYMLSGGQKQRLNLLRALALDTDVLILDEPLNGLDFESATRVIAMLHRKMQAGMGLLVISHNEEIFDALAGVEGTYYLHSATLSAAVPIGPESLR